MQIILLNQILPENGRKRYAKKLPKIFLTLTKIVQIAPQSQVHVVCRTFQTSINLVMDYLFLATA